jgi:hypothetical protein
MPAVTTVGPLNRLEADIPDAFVSDRTNFSLNGYAEGYPGWLAGVVQDCFLRNQGSPYDVIWIIVVSHLLFDSNGFV